MRWVVYNVLFAIGYVLMLPRFAARMWRRGGYRKDFLQRLGVYRPEVLARLRERRRIWIHAVSVGEVGVALRFMEEFRAARPESSFVLSTTTSTGHAMAEGKVGFSDVLIYYPSDFPGVVRRVLEIVNPPALVLTEGELWPNMILTAKKRGVAVVLINGRISEKSFAGYRKLRGFFGPVLRAMDLLLAQSEGDRERLEAIGAKREQIRVMGSAKYDAARADTAGAETARRLLGMAGMGEGDLIVVGGSTWAGEEAALCGICGRLRAEFPRLRLVLAPRHAERRLEAEADIRASGLSWLRRSTISAEALAAGGKAAEAKDVLLVDSTGELTGFYAVATVIFVGKSLTNRGGQNIIEPALLGKAVIVGPHMENFPAVIDDFVEAGAIRQVADAQGLEEAIRELLRDATAREDCGRRARELVERKRGAVRESVKMILEMVERGGR